MKNNKFGKWGAILLFSLFISSCPDPFTPDLPEILPEGYGSFSLIVENASRTILPTAPHEDDFHAYTLEFTVTGGGESKTENRTSENYTSPVILKTGTYSLTVSAYLDAGKTKLAARGTETGIVIGSGANVAQTVILKTISDLGSGTFHYNVTISAPGVTSATMVITKNGATTNVTLAHSGPTSADLPLAVGVYNVRFTLIKADAESVWNEILHVYAELTSNFTITFDDEYFYRTHYNVTFVYNYEDAPSDYLQSVIHGGTLTEPTPTREGYTFEGWYTNSGLTVLYSSAPVYKDFTLYAKWEESRGTEDNPFIVDSETKLRYVGKGDDNPDLYKTWTLTAHYEQTANIDLTGKDVWTAIGRDGPPYDGSARFTGTYNGGGHTIKGLTLNPTLQYQGMFGYIGAGGTVENLGLIDVNITCNASAGGIAGRSEGTIQNCYVTGSVTGNSMLGGIAGENSTGTIQNCYFIGSVTGSANSIGGIAGVNSGGTIQNCYVSGNVTGGRDVGGIAGGNLSGGTIQNCYVAGSVTATEMLYNYNGVGGIVGRNDSSNIRNCVALNEIITITGTGTYTNIGRITGTSSTWQNNYAWSGMKLWVYGSRVSASADVKNGESITAANAKTSATWTTAGKWNNSGIGVWNFDDVWQWNGTSGMPSLQGVGTVLPWPPHLDFDPGVPPANTGDGSSSNPFNVWNEETLRYVGKGTANPTGYTGWTLTAYYEQTANITLTQGEWTRIGSGYNTSSFTGSYNGGGHTITGLTIIVTADNQGMFGYIGTGGKVENLALINVDINGTGNYIGGIAGVNSGGTIQNCYVSGSVTAGYVLGGIAGQSTGTIQNCYVIGDVEGGSDIGGIVGNNTSGTIQNCYAIGSVTSQNSVGGIAGSGGQSIQNCVALNESVTTQYTNTSIGRVFGSSSTGTFQNNHAWSGMTVTVTGGGTYTPDATAGGKDGVSMMAANAKNNSWWTTNTAWDFSGVWELNGANGMPSLKVFGNTVPPWPGYLVDTVITHTVTFNANSGTPAPTAQTVNNGGKVTEPSGVTRGNYTLEGWYKEAAFTNKWNFNTDTVTADTTLYARWTYTVTYDLNGGTGTIPAALTVNAGDNVQFAAGTGITREGHSFAGWNAQADGKGNNYNPSTTYTTSTTPAVPNGNITLYASWLYTVTFNANGGTGTAPSERYASPGTGITIPDQGTLVRTGYTFGGWNTQADGTGTNYAAGVTNQLFSGSITLYAKWASDNPTEWVAVTQKPSTLTDAFKSIAYANNRFVAGDDYGKMAYSTDGSSWMEVSNSTFGTNGINGIAYGNNRWVAVGSGGKMAFSTDNGVTWTAVSNTQFDYNINGIAFGNGRFVIVGNNGRMAYSSDDGVTWTSISTSVAFEAYNNSINAIAYGNNRWVAVGQGGKIGICIQ